ncbi:hypothetical protein GCM10018791_72210 [Streptomyces zaomyceticus]|nr:hypothetical protein GCM10018791_72210 [Streptomyces zaomyceticus]
MGDVGAARRALVEPYALGEVVGRVDQGHPGVGSETEGGHEPRVTRAEDEDTVGGVAGALLRCRLHAQGTA